jgi:hypothetical protein
LCFNASLFIDGRYACDVSNAGHGGANRYDFADRDLEQRFHDWCRSQRVPCFCAHGRGTAYGTEIVTHADGSFGLTGTPVKGNCNTCANTGMMRGDADIVIGDIIDAIETAKEKARVEKGIARIIAKSFADPRCGAVLQTKSGKSWAFRPFRDVASARAWIDANPKKSNDAVVHERAQ